MKVCEENVCQCERVLVCLCVSVCVYVCVCVSAPVCVCVFVCVSARQWVGVTVCESQSVRRPISPLTSNPVVR